MVRALLPDLDVSMRMVCSPRAAPASGQRRVTHRREKFSNRGKRAHERAVAFAGLVERESGQGSVTIALAPPNAFGKSRCGASRRRQRATRAAAMQAGGQFAPARARECASGAGSQMRAVPGAARTRGLPLATAMRPSGRREAPRSQACAVTPCRTASLGRWTADTGHGPSRVSGPGTGTQHTAHHTETRLGNDPPTHSPSHPAGQPTAGRSAGAR